MNKNKVREVSNILYFAYGSNLYINRLKKRVGDWKASQKAVLNGWKLVFDKPSTNWGSAANIRKNSNEQVFGVVYLLTEKQFKKLQKYEQGYIEIEIPRESLDLNLNEHDIPILTFIYTNKPSLKNPRPKYLKFIIEGLKQHGFKIDIIKKVKKIADN